MENTTVTQEEITLAPSYTLSIIIILIGIALTVWQLTTGIITALFGLFLLVQTFLIKLKFTPTALQVYRGNQQIRSFPYSEWQNWVIYFPSVPILFYFKEVKSIHFVPVIFNSTQLKDCLEKYCSLK